MDDSSLEAECDEEIARYSSQANNKKKLIENGGDEDDGASSNSVNRRHNNHHEEDPPRPMSWDGGLSDTENSVVRHKVK